MESYCCFGHCRMVDPDRIMREEDTEQASCAIFMALFFFFSAEQDCFCATAFLLQHRPYKVLGTEEVGASHRSIMVQIGKAIGQC